MARLRTRHCFACVLCALLVWIAAARADRALQPILYTVRVTAPATHDADVEGTFPTGRRATIDLMMPVWTPGFYRADDYAGKVAQITARTHDGRPLLVDAGRPAGWDGARAAADLAKTADAVHAMWGSLPFTRYLFLNVFRDGGGGLELRTSTLLTANAARAVTPDGYHRWLGFVGHEYFQAFNAKRLRPIELGPFDYDNPPR